MRERKRVKVGGEMRGAELWWWVPERDDIQWRRCREYLGRASLMTRDTRVVFCLESRMRVVQFH